MSISTRTTAAAIKIALGAFGVGFDVVPTEADAEADTQATIEQCTGAPIGLQLMAAPSNKLAS